MSYLWRVLFCYIVGFQKISIPYPQMVLPIRVSHPLEFPFHLPAISYIPSHGLNLAHLEIIDRVPLKINCFHLKIFQLNIQA